MNSMPEDKTFVDMNIIIYAYDVTAGNKHGVAGDQSVRRL
jgi:predicted nucleic acid-binding protein